ncbi:nose resistant to fluoxetine protein 6-like [Schistocerca cancellata]|uniref:nose resistant to fluoxetine protein 6-like n=1 Tax=Schistocerca cancellata TaxID=274614 RepID=UPI002119910E|nr:nose resistant to fluoxetine protein 6-like [Schistocerca cancellata]
MTQGGCGYGGQVVTFPAVGAEMSGALLLLLLLLAAPALATPAHSHLEWLLDLYNPLRWRAPPADIQGDCGDNLHQLIEELRNGSLWASSMVDASGRYSSQFLFGNDLWLGSQTLCDETAPSAPWPVTFYVARLRLRLSPALTPQTRTVLLGVCVPASCGPQQVSRLLEVAGAAGAAGAGRELSVVRVRPVPGGYRVLADPRLHIIWGVAAVLLVLMAAGTVYDLVLRWRRPPADKAAASAPAPAGKCSRLLLAFSARINGQKILKCEGSDEALGCVHGMRFLSLAWVIMVHTYLQVFSIAENKTLRSVTERSIMYQTISNATFSVDTFFFISGLLVTFLFLRSAASKDNETKTRAPATIKSGVLQFFKLVFYRFIRLTPVYLYVLGLVELSMKWLNNKSVFEPNVFDHINCENFWWRNALYINSLFPRKEMCMLWSWYMANDTQFYVLGILLLLISTRFFRTACVAWAALLLCSWSTTAFISVQYEYKASIQEPFALFDQLYDKPWTRIGPYLVGMATGWILLKTKCVIRIPLMCVFMGWVASLLCLISLVYGLPLSKLEVYASASYVSLGHTAWCLALAWITIACCAGYGGAVNSLLSFRALYPLSRLTYCAYLVHPLIMFLTSFQMDGPLHIHNGLVVVLYLGNVVAAFLLAFVISLMLESPIVNILKLGMQTRKRDS